MGVRERASRLLRCSGYVLCRQSEGRRPRLPTDLHQHICEGRLRQAVRSQDADQRGGSAQRPGVLPFFDEHDVKLLRVLTDRGSEYCGNPERHEIRARPSIIRALRPRARADGICERFHKIVLNEFYRVAFRKRCTVRSKSCRATWIAGLRNTMARPHQGRWCFRQNSEADLPRCNVVPRRKCSLTISDTKT
jgi:hypothetical protein